VKDHSVFSFGYTRALWDGGNAEDVQRMKGYAEKLGSYVVVTNSYRRHRLQPLRPRKISRRFDRRLSHRRQPP
jgi:hypothetical protein